MVSLKKIFAAVIIFGFFCSAVALVPGSVYAKKSKAVRMLVAGGNEGAPENSAEVMGLNMYLGALDYRMRTFHVLKGKYHLQWVSTLFDNANECLTGVASGAGEMTFSGPHYLEQLDPGWKAVEAPGVFDNWDHFMRTINTEAWKALEDKMAKEKGVRIVKWMANIGDWYLFTNKGPIRTMADLSGQKIRFAGGEAFANALKNMGTTPISLPYTEVVTGLQTHMIDGLLTDYLAAYYFYSLPRYTKYAVSVVWAIQPICIVVNNQWWESMPANERTAIKDVFDRIDTSQYFDGVQKYIEGGWNANPKTELIRLSDEESRKWKAAMKKGSQNVLDSIDPSLAKAIEASR
ncbi:TRAP transporter substrate-binding protein DctP [bacterium]|nr:TRAP transporter substrate-binding protein DctP [bacterium]